MFCGSHHVSPFSPQMPAKKGRGSRTTSDATGDDNVAARDVAARSSLQHLGSEDAMYSLTGDDDDMVSDREMKAAADEAKNTASPPVGGKFTFTPAVNASPMVPPQEIAGLPQDGNAKNSQPRRPRDPVQFPMRPSIFDDPRQAEARNARLPPTNRDGQHTVDMMEHWEEDGIQVARSPRYSLKPFKKEIATITFLLIVGIVCFSLGLARMFDGHSGGLIMLIIGTLTLIPGSYFAFAFLRAYRTGAPFTALEFS